MKRYLVVNGLEYLINEMDLTVSLYYNEKICLRDACMIPYSYIIAKRK